MRARLLSSLLAVLGVLGIVVGINMFADARLSNLHADVTQGRLYTLAPGTRSILRGLKEPVTLRLFYSRDLGSTIPAYGSYADHVREMLREYAAVSHGRVRLEFYNPEPFSDTEDRALAYGLQGVPVDQSGEQVFFGLAGTNLLDDEQVIPFFQPERERFLEYDLTKLIYDLSNPTRPVVGVMSSLPLDGDPRTMMMSRGQQGGPWRSMLELRQTNTVKSVPTDTQAIDPDIQVLLVVQPQHLSPATQYAIDQFVMRGGRLMALVDPWSETEAANANPEEGPPPDASSDLRRLFDAWGIEFDPNKVVGDLTGAWRVRAGQDSDMQAADYVAWFNIRMGINHDDPATADLTQVTVASAGALAAKPGTGITFTPLLSSSAQSELLPVDDVKDPNPAKILAAFKPSGGPRVIAARVHGVLKSAFNGPPPLAKGQTRPKDFPAHIAHTSGPANLVVIADTDILADRFWVRVQDFFGQPQATPISDNGTLIANLVGTLAGGDALIGLRSRGDSVRPFDLVNPHAGRRRGEVPPERERAAAAPRRHAEAVAGDPPGQRPAGQNAEEAVITPDQHAAIAAARADILTTRQQLRAVQRALNQDIGRLETQVRLADIALVPVLVALVAIVLGLLRARRRGRARA